MSETFVKPEDSMGVSAAAMPRQSLLRNWGKRLSAGGGRMLPVYVGGSWTLHVPRGNKRVLRLVVGSARTPKA